MSLGWSGLSARFRRAKAVHSAVAVSAVSGRLLLLLLSVLPFPSRFVDAAAVVVVVPRTTDSPGAHTPHRSKCRGSDFTRALGNVCLHWVPFENLHARVSSYCVSLFFFNLYRGLVSRFWHYQSLFPSHVRKHSCTLTRGRHTPLCATLVGLPYARIIY